MISNGFIVSFLDQQENEFSRDSWPAAEEGDHVDSGTFQLFVLNILNSVFTLLLKL